MIAAALMLAAAVLARPVERGTVLTPDDLVTASEEHAPGLPIDDAVGKETVRWLPAGAVLRSSDLAPPRLVRRGEAVTIRVMGGGLVIATAGRALGDGRKGDTVRVLAPATRRTLEGTVDATGSVRITAP